jgi:hypothetical protein
VRIVPFCLAIKSDRAGQLDPAAHHQPALTDHANFPFDSPRQSGLCTKASIWPHCGVASANSAQRLLPSSWPRTLSSADSGEGFCLSTHVLALVPTTPNPTVYRVHLYQTCTFSVPFRRKPARNRGCDDVPVFACAIPKPATPGPVKRRPNIARNLIRPEIAPVLAARAKGGERKRCLPDAQERKEGPFPPQETAFHEESCRNISGQQ